MAARSDSSLAVVLLTQRLVDASASPLKASECWSLLERVPDPAVLLGLGVDEIASSADVDVDRAQQMRGLFDAATAVAFALDELEQSGIRVLTCLDDGYPASLLGLGSAAPPLLHVAGDVALLSAPLLGVVGSRDVSEAGAEVAVTRPRRGSQRARDGVGRGEGRRPAGDGRGARVGRDRGRRARRLAGAHRPRSRRPACDHRRDAVPVQPVPAVGAVQRRQRDGSEQADLRAVAGDVRRRVRPRAAAARGAARPRRCGAPSRPVLVWTGDGAGPGNARLVELGATAVDSIDELFPLPSHRDAPDIVDPSGAARARGVTWRNRSNARSVARPRCPAGTSAPPAVTPTTTSENAAGLDAAA